MNESLTRGEAQLVVNDLNSELLAVKRAMSEGGIMAGGIEVLEQKKNAIQKKIDELLKKGGVITEQDYTEAYQLIRRSKQMELVDIKSKRESRTILFLSLILMIAGGYIVYKNLKK